VPVDYSRAVGDDGNAVIAFRNVSFSRGATVVLRSVDFGIAAGETVALVGRSGAGKSTILKLINRLLLPASGSVLVEGRPTTAWDPYDLRRRAGYVLQDVGLFPHLTVEANVSIVPRLLGWAADRVAARTRELLELTGLDPATYADRRPHELSGGQRQRVGVARALAADPPILLMDEPFGALDPVTRSEMHREFKRIQARVGKTTVIVTHDMAEAFVLGSRIGVIADGELIALEAPAAIGRSADDRVRALLQPLLEAGEALRGADE